MNERIRELLEQAGYKPVPGFDFANSLEEQFMEKFAELIVKECALWIELQDEAEHPTAWLLSEELKEHFGVEE